MLTSALRRIQNEDISDMFLCFAILAFIGIWFAAVYVSRPAGVTCAMFFFAMITATILTSLREILPSSNPILRK